MFDPRMSLYAAHERAKVQSFFENQRLSRETREADNHLLATVGDWMVRAGTALKRRYRDAEPMPVRPTIRLEPQR